jgi:cold shock CspA family protein
MQVYEGHITLFDFERNAGFIETDNKQSYYFFLNKSAIKRQSRAGLIKHAHQFCTGDEVSFMLQQSNRNPSKKEAYDISFIKNDRRPILMQEAANSNALQGYLRQTDNKKYFVQHLSTLIYIELEISKWEANLDATYQDRLDTIIEFKMLQPKKNDQLFAVLTDRVFKKEYQELAQLLDAQTSIPATVTDSNSHGYFVTILNNNTTGFIDCNKEKLTLYNFEKGTIVNVVVKGSHENGIRVAVV